MRHPLQEIQRLQGWRGRKPADLSIARLVDAAAANAERTHRRLGELIDLWQELLPERLAKHTVLAAIRNGVLQVKADSASTAFEVDRLLRGGLEADLRKRYRGTLLRVRLRVEPLDDERNPAIAPPARRRAARKSGAGGAARPGDKREGRPPRTSSVAARRTPR